MKNLQEIEKMFGELRLASDDMKKQIDNFKLENSQIEDRFRLICDDPDIELDKKMNTMKTMISYREKYEKNISHMINFVEVIEKVLQKSPSTVKVSDLMEAALLVLKSK